MSSTHTAQPSWPRLMLDLTYALYLRMRGYRKVKMPPASSRAEPAAQAQFRPDIWAKSVSSTAMTATEWAAREERARIKREQEYNRLKKATYQASLMRHSREERATMELHEHLPTNIDVEKRAEAIAAAKEAQHNGRLG